MVVLNRRQLPPWELCSRALYRKWKDRKNKNISNLKHLYTSFKLYEKAISTIEASNTHKTLETTQSDKNNKNSDVSDSDVINTHKDKLSPYISDICVRFQQLSHTPLQGYQGRLCVSILRAIESAMAHISTECLFKFLVSYSKLVNSRVYMPSDGGVGIKFSLKLNSAEICKKLFGCLEERGFEINSNNICQLIESYTRLCVGYGQEVKTMCKIYNRSILSIKSGIVKLQIKELDRLLLLFDRMGVYDKHFVVHYSNKIVTSFGECTENQIGNFCRYMTKLPFVESKPSESHIDLLKSRSCQGDSKKIEAVSNRQYVKRLPRHYAKALLNRRSYEFAPKVDYSKNLSDQDQLTVLKGWDFKNSKFVRSLNRRLPYVLHQYTYFNLIDVAEMYYIYEIKSELLSRFATELWKYLYTLKYGYALKSLIVLSCLKQGDAMTYGRLIRNIPAALCFDWSPELVAEALIACGSLGIRKSSIYNKLSEYLQARIAYFKDSGLVCRIFESLSMARVPQYGLYYQMVTLSESFPDWLHLRHLIHIAKSCCSVGMLERRMFKLMVSRMSQVSECSLNELIPIIKLSSEVNLECADSHQFYRFIVHFLESVRSNDDVGYEELLELLEGMASIQVRTCEAERLAVKVIGGAQDGFDVVKILKYLGILGRVESKELLQILSDHIDKSLNEFDEHDVCSLIWDMISVGYELYSETLLKVVRKFTQLKPKNCNAHLLTVVASLVRLSDGSHAVWKEFLKVVDEYKHYSWPKSEETVRIIKCVSSTIKNSKTFVQQFPYTVDITAKYENIENTYISPMNMRMESESNYGVEPIIDVGDPVRVSKASLETQKACLIDGPEASKDDVALFYYNSKQNPFILHIKSDGTHEHYFNFYYQTRRRILQNRGWKDTLIFSPNN